MKQKNDKKITPLSCDWKSPSSKREVKNKNIIIRYRGNFKWRGVKEDKYKNKEDGWSSITRSVLIGNNGEDTRFHVRYFEIQPGGYSSYEWHKHTHVVICLRGKGLVRLDKKRYPINYLDTIYIAPNIKHQLINPYNEPFGFLCIVNSKRDMPKPVK